MQDSFDDLDISELDILIKLFLPDVDEFDKAAADALTAGGRDSPMWIGKGNFISLFNLPAVVKLFGLPQNLWDGDQERFVQIVKPFIHGNYSTNGYLITTSDRIHATILLQLQIQRDLEAFGIQKEFNNTINFCCCNSWATVVDQVESGKPVSGILVKRGEGELKVWLVYSVNFAHGSSARKAWYQCLEALFDDSQGGWSRFGSWFSLVCLTEVEEGPFTISELLSLARAGHHVVLDSSEGILLGKDRECSLTQWHSIKNQMTRYHIFSDSWKEHDSDRSYHLLGVVMARIQ
jgi:hypothetical protein